MAEITDMQIGEGEYTFIPPVEYSLSPEDLFVLDHSGDFNGDGANISYVTQHSDGSGSISHVASAIEPNPTYTGNFVGLGNLAQSSSSNELFVRTEADLNILAGGETGATILGRTGDQSLTGGNGADTFIVQSAHGLSTGDDTFLNFDPLEDTIQFSFVGDFEGAPANEFRVDAIETDTSTRYSILRQDGEAGYTEIGTITIDAIGLPEPGWYEIG